MDKETDKKLDELMSKVFKEAPLESTSLNFTSKIIGQIETLHKNNLFAYKPLIPKFIWAFIALFMAAVFGLVIFVGVKIEYPWMASLNFDRLPDFQWFENLSQIRVSNTLVYAIIGFTFFACLQIMLIKRHFDKRFIVH